jgi:transposase
MNQEKPKVYTFEFRESAVKLANETIQSIAQTARNLGINENTLHTCISKYSRPVESVKAVRADDHLYGELRRLKKESRPHTEQRNLLLCSLVKKAVAYFAKEHQ